MYHLLCVRPFGLFEFLCFSVETWGSAKFWAGSVSTHLFRELTIRTLLSKKRKEKKILTFSITNIILSSDFFIVYITLLFLILIMRIKQKKVFLFLEIWYFCNFGRFLCKFPFLLPGSVLWSEFVYAALLLIYLCLKWKWTQNVI